MTLNEYNKIKNLNYREYCSYLQNKYGFAPGNYLTKNWNKNKRCTRTDEGLLIHHIFEDHAVMLSNPNDAKNSPYEWQEKENLVCCNYLEHLLLHILICENPAPNKNESQDVGVGGAVNFIIPLLNDYYSGWQPKAPWQYNCLNIIKNEQKVYFALIKRFKNILKNHPVYNEDSLYRSYNELYGGWNSKKNFNLYLEIGLL